jgi:sialic acid synthase
VTYIVAEIGQNHNGAVQMATALIDMCARPTPHTLPKSNTRGVDAVKFTMRDLEHECTPEMMAQRYTGPHSFGATYGEHRAALELSPAEHAELYRYAKALGLDFIETLCAPRCVGWVLELFAPDRLKVASRDLTNLPLLEKLADTGIPVILSTGMASLRDIRTALDAVGGGTSVTLLHCLSSYPAHFGELNMRRIGALRDLGYPVGYSDHSQGIVAPVAAVALGATLIEKHVTLDRSMRGTDHAGSLERDGLWRMVRDIRNTELALGSPEIERNPASEGARAKLERSCVTSSDLPAGTLLTEDHLSLLSPGTGYRWADRHAIVGSVLTEDLLAGTILTDAHLAAA